MADRGCLPPGVVFHPSDELLVVYYLRRYISGEPLPEGIITPADVYGTEPWNLVAEGKDEAYFFACRTRSGAEAKRICRTAGEGSWYSFKKEEISSSMDGKGEVTVGIKHNLAFNYKGKKHMGWIMYEFELCSKDFQELVLCRIKRAYQNIARIRREKKYHASSSYNTDVHPLMPTRTSMNQERIKICTASSSSSSLHPAVDRSLQKGFVMAVNGPEDAFSQEPYAPLFRHDQYLPSLQQACVMIDTEPADVTSSREPYVGPDRHGRSPSQQHAYVGPDRHGRSPSQQHAYVGPDRHGPSPSQQHAYVRPHRRGRSPSQQHAYVGPDRHGRSPSQQHAYVGPDGPDRHGRSPSQQHAYVGPDRHGRSPSQQHAYVGPDRHGPSPSQQHAYVRPHRHGRSPSQQQGFAMAARVSSSRDVAGQQLTFSQELSSQRHQEELMHQRKHGMPSKPPPVVSPCSIHEAAALPCDEESGNFFQKLLQGVYDEPIISNQGGKTSPTATNLTTHPAALPMAMAHRQQFPLRIDLNVPPPCFTDLEQDDNLLNLEQGSKNTARASTGQ